MIEDNSESGSSDLSVKKRPLSSVSGTGTGIINATSPFNATSKAESEFERSGSFFRGSQRKKKPPPQYSNPNWL